MPSIFVSHAYADRDFVDAFFDDILRLGCELERKDLFYSSRVENGVPSGADLMAYVRERVSEATLVIAIISPTYQKRPVCVAELGAAWSRTNNLFPLLVPGMPREALEGVLPSMLTRYIDDREALNELHGRIKAIGGPDSHVATWDRALNKWLVSVKAHARKLPREKLRTDSQFDALEARVSELRGELSVAQEQIADLMEQRDQLVNLSSSQDDALEIVLPKDKRERFLTLAQAASEALDRLPNVVADAIWHKVVLREDMEIPHAAKDEYRHDEVMSNITEGLLERYEGTVEPVEEFDIVREAADATRRLLRFFEEEEREESFDMWFHKQYKGPLDLTAQRVWNAVLGR